MRIPASRTAAWRAWAVSLVVHATVIGVIGWTWESDTAPPVPPATDPFHLILDSAPESDPPLQLTIVKSVPPAEAAPVEAAPVAVASTGGAPAEPPLMPTTPSEPPPPMVPVAEPPPPPEDEKPAIRVHRPVPPVIPERIQELVRELAEQPQTAVAVQDVVDLTTVAATELVESTPIVTAAVRTPATPMTTPTQTSDRVATGSPAGANPAEARPIHGRLPAGSSIVYVLDCSGTMGLDGKLDRARNAIRATRATQLRDVVVNIVIYQGRARLLPPEHWQEQLRELEPSGSSQHAEGVRAALKLKPGYIVLFTDARVEELAELRPVLRGANRPVSLSVVQVERTRLNAPILFR